MKKVHVGIIGFGIVGSGVASCLIENNSVIAKRTGIMPVLSKIADIDIKTDRGIELSDGILTNDPYQLINEVDIVVELVGGTTHAKEFILEALKQGKPVVTANKALLAKCGEEIFAASEESEANIYYEASVGGGIPIIKGLREGLVGNKIKKIYGILNGTCNYILTRMENEQIEFSPILVEAQKLGYAEVDPKLDIDGSDTAHKAVILSSLAYGEWFDLNSVYKEGITDISLLDIKFAAELGYRIKLMAIIKEENNDVQIRVHPTLIPSKTLFAGINDVFNGILVNGTPIGETIFYGQGAGKEATSSAVIADIVDVALNLKFGSHRRVPPFRIGKQFKHTTPMCEIKSRYYLRIQVIDVAGVMAKISSVLGEENISISSLTQKEGQSSSNVSLIIITHETKEKLMTKAIKEIESLKVVHDNVKYIRIEDI